MAVKPTLVTVCDQEFERVWKVFTEVGQYERHFNTLQLSYRSLASTWLLAAFGATGFIFGQHASDLPVRPLLAVTLVGLGGAIGVTLLWVLDILVYNQLLDACFDVGYRLECAYPWLPYARKKMRRTQSHQGVTPRVVRFYVIGVLAMLALAGSACVFWLNRDHQVQSGWALFLISAAWLVFATLVCLMIDVWSAIVRTQAQLATALEPGPLSKATLKLQAGPPPLRRQIWTRMKRKITWGIAVHVLAKDGIILWSEAEETYSLADR